MLRRTQVFDTNTKKAIYTNDCIVISEKIDAVCDAKGYEEKSVVFDIPQSVFVTKEEEDRIKVPLMEKALVQGPSSSLSGRLFKV